MKLFVKYNTKKNLILMFSHIIQEQYANYWNRWIDRRGSNSVRFLFILPKIEGIQNQRFEGLNFTSVSRNNLKNARQILREFVLFTVMGEHFKHLIYTKRFLDRLWYSISVNIVFLKLIKGVSLVIITFPKILH